MKQLHLLVLALVLLLNPFNAGATHIVGGDFYYRQVGNNRYEITMKLYIDCENGNPSAIQSDAQAIIGIFDAGTNNFERSFIMTRTGPVRLNKLQYKCVIPEQGVCVDQYTYVRTETINPGQNGKILSFQRCCRNNTINNIVNPESTGATYWVKIPGSNTVSNDNSPVFKELPPNYICTNAPLIFDHSATDADGDSLVYELYNPYTGANKDFPRPDNTMTNGYFDDPPFVTVTWRSAYSTGNQIGGNPILTIDPQTGLLTATPTTVGQFVIGVKVKEYRKGVLIGETLRDYQVNVRDCKFDIVSAFAAPVYACSDTVTFNNQSYKATSYTWDFGDPTTKADTSHEINPTYVYPGNGKYRVTLTAKNSVCEDVYYTTVTVKSKIQFSLGPDDTTCVTVDRFLNTNVFDATKIQWNTGQFGPYIRATKPGMYAATVFYGNCFASDSIDLVLDPATFYVISDTIYCDSVAGTISVNTYGRNDYTFKWNNNNKDTGRYLTVSKPGFYAVEVSNRYCKGYDTAELWLATKPEIGNYLFVCNEFSKQFDAGDLRDATYLWSDGSTGRYNTLTQAGKYWVQVTQRNCVKSDTIEIENPVIPLDLGLDRHYCDSFGLLLSAPANMRSYLWSDNSTLQNLFITNQGTYWVQVFDTNGCDKSDTISVNVTQSPAIDIGNDTTICYRSVVELGVEPIFAAYKWNNGAASAKINTEEAGIYELEVTDSFGCKGKASVMITVDANALPNDLYFPNAFTPDGDGLNEYFPYSFPIAQPEFSVKVFNRWGEKVFDSIEEGKQHWNGLYKDGILRPEAYMFIAEYRGCDGNYRRKSGTVTVLK